MKTSYKEPNEHRKDHPRTSEEVPLFPYQSGRMSHLPADPFEQAQYDFVRKAGQASLPPNADNNNQA